MKHVVVITLVALIAVLLAAPASAGPAIIGAPDASQAVLGLGVMAAQGSSGSLALDFRFAGTPATGIPVMDGSAPGSTFHPDCTPPSVPEPGTLSLLGTSLLGLFGLGLRRRKAS
ncbi:MAG TPA: PEP-CTERM sorting domain-containing protein [Candidatus Saccharimonadales bacterium]|nr:PEP-CTERM sorting domain-containing protein [Candidatus Saccharimonadales bacterium]